MSDMIKRKLDEAKKNLAKLEKDANREPPKERKTKDMSMNVPEVPPDNFKPDENRETHTQRTGKRRTPFSCFGKR